MIKFADNVICNELDKRLHNYIISKPYKYMLLIENSFQIIQENGPEFYHGVGTKLGKRFENEGLVIDVQNSVKDLDVLSQTAEQAGYHIIGIRPDGDTQFIVTNYEGMPINSLAIGIIDVSKKRKKATTQQVDRMFSAYDSLDAALRKSRRPGLIIR